MDIRKMDTQTETARLNAISKDSGYDKGINAKMIHYTAELFKRHMKKPGSVLELGPAQGLATDILVKDFPDYTIVDGAEDFVSMIQSRHPSINCNVSLFEDFKPNRTFDNIVMSHVLEHVQDPVQILNKCRSWLSGGVLLAAVPNKTSLHRQAGVKMGMLKDIGELHAGDLKIGHRRVYDMNAFVEDFHKAGFNVIKQGGYWIKQVSNSQIEGNWSDELIQAYMEIGEEYPEIACNIYVVATSDRKDGRGW